MVWRDRLSGISMPDFGNLRASIMNTKIYESPNGKSRPGGEDGFGAFGLIEKIPPGQFWPFDHVIFFVGPNHILFLYHFFHRPYLLMRGLPIVLRYALPAQNTF